MLTESRALRARRARRPSSTRTSHMFVPVWVSVILGFMAVVLVTFPDQLIVRTWVTCLGGLCAIWGVLIHQYGLNIPLRTNVAAVMGFSAAYLLPPLYLSLRLANGHRVDAYGVADQFPMVAILGTVGALMLLAGYRLGTPRHVESEPADEGSVQGTILIVGAILVVAWCARAVLIFNGSYYYVFSNESFMFGRWFSVTGGIAKYGLVGAMLLWLLAARRTQWVPAALVVTAAEVAYMLPTGARKEIVQFFLGLILLNWYVRSRPPFVRFGALFLVSAIMLPLLGGYRYTISQQTTGSSISLGATMRATEGSSEMFQAQTAEGGSVLEYGDVFFNRLYDGQCFGYLLKHYTDTYDWEYGRTYSSRIPWLLLPYFLYPDRPISQVPLDDWFRLVAGGSDPTTFLGEAYINFGYAGIPLVCLAMGWILAKFDLLFRRHASRVVASGVFILTAAQVPFMASASAASWLGVLRNGVIMFFVFSALQHFFDKRSQRSRAFVARTTLPASQDVGARRHRRI